jgi:hypothetical protein
MQTFIFILDKFTAKTIEIIISICDIIGIILSICGLSNIPFYIGKTLLKNFFTTNIYLLIAILLITIIIIILRKLRLINRKFNTFAYFLSIISTTISVLGFIINVFIDTFILNNMYDFDTKAKKENTEQLYKKQWINTLFIFISLFLLYFLLIFLGLSDYLRINLKINDSYYKFQLAIEEDMRNKEKENVLKNIKEKLKENNNINNNNNNLNVIKENNINNQLINSDNNLKKELRKAEEKKI